LRSYGNEKIVALLQEAVDIEAHGEALHHEMMLWCQAHGLQGHKRWHRWNSGEDRRHYIRLQNYALDMFGSTIRPKWDYTIPTPADIKDYLEAYLAWECSVYEDLAAISNDLILVGCPCEAELVRDGLPRKEIEKARRWLTEYSISGWDMPYILERDKALHEKMKEKERE
jgi:hypothetical protein